MGEAEAASLEDDSEQAIDAAIAAQELLAQNIRDELIRLRRRRNDAIPAISRLPHEILAEIFTLFVYQAHQTRPYHTSCLYWIRVTHVCARWRSMARSIPQLWSVIYTTQNPECTDMFLSLSQNSPLSIVSDYADHTENVDTRFFIPLTRVMDRIQQMRLTLKWHNVHDLLTLHHVSQDAVLPTSAPLLETLDLNYIPTSTHVSDEGRILATGDGYGFEGFWFLSDPETPMPNLRTLCLVGFPLSLAVDLARPTLTELRVNATRPFCLSTWQTLLAALPLLEVLHIVGIGVAHPTPAMTPVSLPGRDIELAHLREILLVRPGFQADNRGVCTQLLRRLIIPSTCKIKLPLAERDPVSTMDVLMSKKDGRACLGEPQVLTSLRADGKRVQLWAEATAGCTSPEETCAVRLDGCARKLLNIMQQTPTFPLAAVQLLCIQGNTVKVQFLVRFTHLRELHLHHVRCKDWLEGLALLPPTALPRLRSLTLDGPKWRPGDGSKPLSLFIDALLSARHGAGAAIEELHLLRIRRLDNPRDVLWLERMASELPTFTWTRS